MDVFKMDDQEKENQAKLKNMWESETKYLTAKVAFGDHIFNRLLYTWVGLSSKRNLYISGEEIQSPVDWGDLMVPIATGG